MEEEIIEVIQLRVDSVKKLLHFESGYLQEHKIAIVDIRYIALFAYFVVIRTDKDIFVTHKTTKVRLAPSLLKANEDFVQINNNYIVDRSIITKWTEENVSIEIGSHKKFIERTARFKKHFIQKLITA